jgi:hypothetical protein
MLLRVRAVRFEAAAAETAKIVHAAELPAFAHWTLPIRPHLTHHTRGSVQCETLRLADTPRPQDGTAACAAAIQAAGPLDDGAVA